MPVLVLDNGAYEIKAGYASDEAPVRMVNAITRSSEKRTYIGNQVLNCKDYHGLVFRRPQEKGLLVNWDSQKAIWDHLFYGAESELSQAKSSFDPSDTSLILTESPFSLPALSAHTDQIVFEEYGFESYYRCSPGSLVPWNPINSELFGDEGSPATPVAEAALVIDVGFSSTHVMPVMLGEVYNPGVRRLSVGGKILTNYLRETVSFRHYNMMDDTYLINLVKEATAFVSTDFNRDMSIWRKSPDEFRARYLLPDYKTTRTGYLLDGNSGAGAGAPKDETQVLALDNERFLVPELLFHPSDIGLDQAGLPETVMRSINSMPVEVRQMLIANIVVVGGTANLPNLKQRLTTELQPWVPQGSTLRVAIPDNPITYAWNGGRVLGSDQELLQKVTVTRQEYLESGTSKTLSSFQTSTGKWVSKRDESD